MYTRDKKSDFLGRWISAPSALLDQFDRPRAAEFPQAKFIWGRDYVRQHFLRTWVSDAIPERTLLHFACNNSMDIYFNGVCIASDVRDFLSDSLQSYWKKGENILWIRAFQTATVESFTSALIGGIRWEYADGGVEEIVTDEKFCEKRLVDFWVTEEPKDWEQQTSDARNNPLIVSDRHPIAIKRSCYFKKGFLCRKGLKRAWLYASAQGCYEPYINGSRATDALFMPSSTEKAKEYQKFDVTDMLCEGENVVGAITGNGWYNCEAYGRLFANLPSLLMELHLEYEDGRVERIASDRTWQVAPSPLTDNDLQYGERYDARLELDGWATAAGSAGEWFFAEPVLPCPHTELWEQNYPPVRALAEHRAKFLCEVEPGVFLYDTGIEIAGNVRLTLRNPRRGNRYLVQCCERLREDGTPETGAYGAVFYQQDTQKGGRAEWSLRNLNVYIAKGEPVEVYMARFSYTGFRYIYVSGMEKAPDALDVVGVELHNDLKELGTIKTSDRSISGLWEAVKLAWRNNVFNGPTDCPTREKNFWNGDMQIFSHAACWYMDSYDMLARWTDIGRKMQPGPYGWEDEEFELPWTLYRFFGDIEILRAKYPDMLALIQKRREFEGMILPEHPHSPYNDWLNPTGHNLSSRYFSRCWYLRMLDIVSRVADLLGDLSKRDELRALHEKGKRAFLEAHYSYERGEFDEKTQSALVFPLAFDLLPTSERARVGDRLNQMILENGCALTTGFQATRYLLDVLADTGHLDTAVKLLHRREFPSWNYILDTGATSMTESWYGMADPDFSISMSHFSLGAAASFFFEYLGGIRVNDSDAGFSKIVLCPHFHPAIGDLEVRYQTPHGEIVSEWHYEGDRVVWNYRVPDGVEVEIRRDLFK